MAKKKKNQVRAYRGPSRPVDPRFVARNQRRGGGDRFGYALLGGGIGLVLVLIIAVAVLQGGNNNTAAPSVPAANTSVPAAQPPANATNAAATQQAVAFATQQTGLTDISAADALKEYNAQTSKFIDVRDAARYATDHIPTAPNIPYTDAQKRVTEFPKTGNLILYCQ